MPHEHPWLDLPGASSDEVGLIVGLGVVPVLLTLAILARGRNASRLNLGHGAATVVTILVILSGQFYPAAVLVSVSAPLLLLAIIGRNGCELLAVPNLVLRRNDYLFCLPISPIDAWERRRHATRPLVSMEACTLPTSERPLRLAEFDALFASTLHSVEPAGDTHARLVLAGDDGLQDRVQRLAAAESSCCSFFNFDVSALKDGLIAFDIAVPPAYADVLSGLLERAETVRATAQ